MFSGVFEYLTNVEVIIGLTNIYQKFILIHFFNLFRMIIFGITNILLSLSKELGAICFASSLKLVSCYSLQSFLVLSFDKLRKTKLKKDFSRSVGTIRAKNQINNNHKIQIHFKNGIQNRKRHNG